MWSRVVTLGDIISGYFTFDQFWLPNFSLAVLLGHMQLSSDIFYLNVFQNQFAAQQDEVYALNVLYLVYLYFF